MGTDVIGTDGRRLGVVRDEVVALETGRAALVIEPAGDRTPVGVVLLLPRESLRPLRDRGVAVLSATPARSGYGTAEERPVAS
jgi:hypothetical protein